MMLFKIKFSATRSVEVANLTAVIMSGLDPKRKIDNWTGLGKVVLFHGYLVLVVTLMVNGDPTAYGFHYTVLK